MNHRIFAIAASLLAPSWASAETFRCGKWVIDAEVTLSDLTEKCGMPTSRSSRVEDVRARNQYTGGMQKVGETVIETWIYDRGPRAAPMVVTIVDGQVKSIERRKE